MIRKVEKGFFLNEIPDGKAAICTPLFAKSEKEAREELKRNHSPGNCCFRDRMREKIRRERGM